MSGTRMAGVRHRHGWLAAAVAAPTAAPAVHAPGTVGVFLALLLIAGVIALLLESTHGGHGLFALAALVSIASAVGLAFAASSLLGWPTLALGCAILFLGWRWIARRVLGPLAGPLRPVSAVVGAAPVAHAAGVHIGQRGQLLSDAHPIARARFLTMQGPSDLDVMVVGPSARRGATVEVVSMDGLSIAVIGRDQGLPDEPGR
jgi:hypothetical protein